MDRGFALYDRSGRPHGGRAPLDLNAEIATIAGDPAERLAPGTRIAHLHLTVPDIVRAVSFFSAVGFAPNLVLPHMAFADLGAGNADTHRLALNAWQGRKVMPAPAGTARLAHYELDVPDPAVYAATAALPGVHAIDGGLALTDPTGTPFRINAPS